MRKLGTGLRTLSSRKAPSRKLVRLSLTFKEKTSTYFYFQNAEDANWLQMLGLQSVFVHWQRLGGGGGQPVPFMIVPLPFCHPEDAEGQTGLARPKEQTIVYY